MKYDQSYTEKSFPFPSLFFFTMKRNVAGEVITFNNYLLKLPIEVLDLVYTELSVFSKVSLAEVHPYLGKALSWHCRDALKEINLKRYPLSGWETLLSFCGHTVRKATFDESDHEDKFMLLSMFCHNLEILEINFLSDTTRRLRKFDGFLKPKVPIKLMRVCSKMESVKQLIIRQLLQSQIPYLKTLKNVEHLKIVGAYSTRRSWSLAELPLNTLRVAVLRDFSIKSTNEKMHSSTLEKLTIIFCTVKGEMPWLPKLKALHFMLNQCSEDSAFPGWVMQHSETLELLKFWEDTFRPGFFLKVFRGCKNLKTLILYAACNDKNIPRIFFKKFEEILKEHGFNKNKKLKLKLHYQGIEEKRVLKRFCSEMVDLSWCRTMDLFFLN